MIHDELRDYIDKFDAAGMVNEPVVKALRAVVELHKPQEITLPDGEWSTGCIECDNWNYPCKTIEVIEKELR